MIKKIFPSSNFVKYNLCILSVENLTFYIVVKSPLNSRPNLTITLFIQLDLKAYEHNGSIDLDTRELFPKILVLFCFIATCLLLSNSLLRNRCMI